MGITNPQIPPGYYAFAVYYPMSSANYWTNTTTTGYSDFTVNGTIPTPTTAFVSGSWSLAKATSNLPGISFTAPHTGTLEIDFHFPVFTGASTSASMAFTLLETSSSTNLDYSSQFVSNNSTTEVSQFMQLKGLISTTFGTSYNFKIQGVSSNASTVYIGDLGSSGGQLSITAKYIY